MSDEDWAEYRMSPEYAHEVRHVPDEGEPFSDDFENYDRAEFEAQAREDRLEDARREAEEIPLDELEAAAEILDREIQRRKDEDDG